MSPRWFRVAVTAVLAMACGGVGALGATSPRLVPPLPRWLLDGRSVRAGERFLRQRFRAACEEFCQCVRRWR